MPDKPSDDTLTNNAPSPAEFNLLVIDDDSVQRTIISRIGGQAGFNVESAATFDAANGLLTSLRFDGVTLDLGLGDRSGALLLPVIARVGYRLPVLVISGATQQLLDATSVMSRALEIDAEILAKPLNLPRLRECLARFKLQAATARARQWA
ncbi:response regulator [Undibacter mobilis]|uniref:Response regulator n=1 Tax=Undibacter mobilis TaxID=2292256 RepID=A0A371BD88_9BRAD|nr:response regulator [Undibacter mobilis]RDV05311.1 response regulator [Undibacter mobilis]